MACSGSLLSGGSCGFGAFDLDEFSGTHVVDETVDWNGFGHERMVANARNIVEDSLLLVLDGEPFDEFPGAKKFITDDQRANGIVAGPAAGVADDVRIAFGEAGVLGGIEVRVHAGKNGEAARGRESEFDFFTEAGAVLLIGFEHFRKNLAHDIPLL